MNTPAVSGPKTGGSLTPAATDVAAPPVPLRTPPRRDPLWADLVGKWPWIAGYLALAAVLGWVAARSYGQHFWQIDSAMIYTPLPIPEEVRADYEPPTPQTLITLVKSPHCLNTVVTDLNLPVSPRTLDKNLKVTKPYNADAFSLTLEWPDPNVGREIVDRVMAIHAQEVAALRREKVGDALAVLTAEQAARRQKLEAAKKEYAAATGRSNSARLHIEWEHCSKALTLRSADLELTRELLDQCKGRIARAAKRERDVAAGGSERFEVADAGAPYRQRKEELTDLIRTEEQRIKEAEALLPTKEREAEVLAGLRSSRAVSQVEVDRITGEVELLRTQKRNSAKAVEQLRRELAELPLLQVKADRTDLEREQAQLEAKVATSERGVAEAKKDLDRLGDLLTAEAALAAEVRRVEEENRKLDGRIASLERLSDEHVAEFVAAQPAVASAHPMSSNRKSIAALTFAGLASCGLLGLTARRWWPAVRYGSEPAAVLYDMPVLAAAADDVAGAGRQHALTELRRTALKLRPQIMQSGGLTLFTSESEAVEIEDLTSQVARYLSLDGNSVLILDARLNKPNAVDPTRRLLLLPGAQDPANQPDEDMVPLMQPPTAGAPTSGLFHILQSSAVDEAGCIQETALAGVHYLPMGAVSPNPELLASVAMHRLLYRVSEKYDRVLVLGPPLTNPVATEILAGYVDGAVVCLPRGAAEDPKIRQAVDAMRGAGVPWMGAVCR